MILKVSMSLVPHCGHAYVRRLLAICPQLRQFVYVTVVLVSGFLFFIRVFAWDRRLILLLSRTLSDQDFSRKWKAPLLYLRGDFSLSFLRESNSRPSHYEWDTLPTELKKQSVRRLPFRGSALASHGRSVLRDTLHRSGHGEYQVGLQTLIACPRASELPARIELATFSLPWRCSAD